MRQNIQVSQVSPHDERDASGQARATYPAALARVARLHARPSLDAVEPPTALLVFGAAAAFELSVVLRGSDQAFMVGLVCLLAAVVSLLLARVRGFRAARAAGAGAGGDASGRRR